MWMNFFSTAAGAAAALAGLVFVAVSVNLQPIIKYPHLPARAGAAIGALVLILVSSMAMLAPQPARVRGGEIAAFGILGWLLEVRAARKSFQAWPQIGRPRYVPWVYALFGQMETLPFLTGGVLLMMNANSGVHWVAAGAIAAFVFSAISAWVLLIEILR